MTIQLLITTMNLCDPISLLTKINVNSDFIIGNQCHNNENLQIKFKEYSGSIISRTLRGVGNNRNAIIHNSNSDICILSDDDMKFIDNYSEIVKECFNEFDDADVIIFNLNDNSGTRRWNNKVKVINSYNYMNYGAARLAFRRLPVLLSGVSFNTCFGGGCSFSCGEDSLFLRDCIRKGLKIIAVPYCIASLLDDRESSWFKGYTEKFYIDKGVFLAVAHPLLCYLFALYFSIKEPSQNLIDISGRYNMLKLVIKGILYVKTKAYKKR